MQNTPKATAATPARNATSARPARLARPVVKSRPAVKGANVAKHPAPFAGDGAKNARKAAEVAAKVKVPQRPALLTDTPELKALKALTLRVMEELKNPAAVPSNIIMAALREARLL